MAKGKLSLAELMGSKAAGHAGNGSMQLSRLHEVLGDATPELPRNPIGRHRLITALQQRFGDNFRTLPGIKDLVGQFDTEIEFEKRLARMRAIRYEPPKRKEK